MSRFKCKRLERFQKLALETKSDAFLGLDIRKQQFQIGQNKFSLEIFNVIAFNCYSKQFILTALSALFYSPSLNATTFRCLQRLRQDVIYRFLFSHQYSSIQIWDIVDYSHFCCI